MTQTTLFGPSGSDPPPKPHSRERVRQRLLIVVKAAPNPSETYGETVCVAAVSADLAKPGWIRLYPINFRALDDDETFRKYDIVEVDTIPALNDPRRESWKPIMSTLRVVQHLPPWNARRPWLEDYREFSMCDRLAAVRERSDAPSLAMITPKEVLGLDVERHPGWTPEEQRKIDAYVNQLDLLSSAARTPLQPPQYRAFYRYRCHTPTCNGHRQGILDWELVTLQRRHAGLADADAIDKIREKFLTMMCTPSRDVAFFVGNQAKRLHVFSVLGVYYPGR